MSVSIIPVAVFVLQAALVIAAEILSPVKIPTIPAEFYIGLVFPETSSNPFNEDILVNVSLSSEFRYGYAGFTCGTVDKGPANDPSMKAFMIDFQSFSAITWYTIPVKDMHFFTISRIVATSLAFQ
ncbi:hypothetical protein VKT23_012099 [Stygiomarasmius scandens]|uniref:Uncharacterized protein n=1 Tax=Marasmiellus scandens TaxID=2682957 RepID=A0ABR1J7N8_9AGAR